MFAVDVGLFGVPWIGQAPLVLLPPDARTVSLIRITKRYGRFGNNFYQLGNAAILADRLNARRIEIPATFMLAANALPARCDELAVERLSDRPPVGTALAGSFYAPFGLEGMFSCLDSAETGRIVERAASLVFGHHRAGLEEGASTAIAVNFRGGDIFSRSAAPHPWYVQPPASFYVKAIEDAWEAGFRGRVDLVYHDRLNPAVAVVEAWLRDRGFPFQSELRDTRSDLRRLLSAGCVVCAVSTMSEAALLLSQRVRRFYCFRSPSSQLDFAPFLQGRVGDVLSARGVAGFTIDDAAFGYIPQKGWNASDAQLDLLRTYPAANLRQYRSG